LVSSRRRITSGLKFMKPKERDELLHALQARFEKNVQRHKGIAWDKVQVALEGNPEALKSLLAMESTGGEPDVIGRDKQTGTYTFCDCSAESPAGRRSLCYDGAALRSRKENKPKGSAAEMAAAMGIELLTEEQYRALQTLGQHTVRRSRARRSAVLRPTLWQGIRVSQRRGVVLRGPGFPGDDSSVSLAQGGAVLALTQHLLGVSSHCQTKRTGG
jgi:hypothetical protein